MDNHVARLWQDPDQTPPAGDRDYFIVQYIHPPRWNDFEGQRFYFTAKD